MKNNDYNIKGIKGIFLPDIYKWQVIEYFFKIIIKNYFYIEMKLPVIEKQDLFKKTLGRHSDIIKRNVFFKDKNNQCVTLIPEGTASCTKELILADMIRNSQK
ncbi:MAG TPA: hypothetical protein ACYCDB_00515 [Candidatus Azoamicus sp.]